MIVHAAGARFCKRHLGAPSVVLFFGEFDYVPEETRKSSLGPMKDKLKIIVSGMVAGNPGQGGASWAVLQYVLGLLRLGHDVYLIEPISDEQLVPASAYFRNIVRDFDLEARCSLLVRGTTRTVGLPYSDLRAIAPGLSLCRGGALHQQAQAAAPVARSHALRDLIRRSPEGRLSSRHGDPQERRAPSPRQPLRETSLQKSVRTA